MPVQSIWKAGHSLVITITKRIANRAHLVEGSQLRSEIMRDGSIRFRPVDKPVGRVSRSPIEYRPRRRRLKA
jgi:antitoxin component of MazEF toxin-antitoxin module